jgi:hypothetical protein
VGYSLKEQLLFSEKIAFSFVVIPVGDPDNH